MNIIKTENYQELSSRAADLIQAQILMKPNCVLGLATGSTPIGTYDCLTAAYEAGRLDFSGVTSVNLDEYYGLDAQSDQSYRYFMNQHLFSRVNIQLENTYVPNGKAEDVSEECKRYDALIDSLGGIDLQLLGIGHNGHIGFNEPCDQYIVNTHCVDLGQSTIDANARFFASADDVPKQAVTMGIGAIMKAKKVLLLASGTDKKEIIEKALYGPVTPQVPASILQMHPDLTIILAVD